MIIKQGNNAIASGTTPRDAEFKLAGSKGTPMCKFSLKVGEDGQRVAIWQTCVCWRTLAERVQGIKKGDNVTVFGTIQSREYNGTTYTDLTCDDVICGAPSTSATPSTPPMPDMQEVEEDDLPF